MRLHSTQVQYFNKSNVAVISNMNNRFLKYGPSILLVLIILVLSIWLGYWLYFIIYYCIAYLLSFVWLKVVKKKHSAEALLSASWMALTWFGFYDEGDKKAK